MKKYGAEEKAIWVVDRQGNGKSARAYAKANGINPATFKRWTEEGAGERHFVEIRTQIVKPEWKTPEVLIEKGDVKIHLPTGITRNDLRQRRTLR
ncbi:MAG: hypothetical protein LBQ67_01220 [Treponema sp.]|nr:hypothetical protein [Treponema sp.]